MSGPAPSPPDALAFRALMGRFATGVTIVTVRANGVDHGLTVNAFLSVSTSPPTVLVSLGLDAEATPELEGAKAFAVNLLAFDQRPLSERFGRPVPAAEKFAGLAVTRGETGAALLPGTLGALEARVTRTIEVADHRLVVGEVVATHVGREAAPLVFFRSRYAASDGGPVLTLDMPPARPNP